MEAGSPLHPVWNGIPNRSSQTNYDGLMNNNPSGYDIPTAISIALTALGGATLKYAGGGEHGDF